MNLEAALAFYALLFLLVVALVAFRAGRRGAPRRLKLENRRVKPLTPLAYAVWSAHQSAVELDEQISLGAPHDIRRAAEQAWAEGQNLADILEREAKAGDDDAG